MDKAWMLWALLLSTISPSLGGLIPGFLTPLPPNPIAELPVIGGLAEAVPAMRNIPGLSFIPKPEGMQANEARNLNNAIEQFSTPLLRLISGDSLLPAQDFEQMLSAVPKLTVKPIKDLPQKDEVSTSSAPPPPAVEKPEDDLTLADIDFSPELFKVLKLLPENYDVKKIPKEVIQSVSRGELPNLALLPPDLQQHFMANLRRLSAQFTKGNLRFEDVISKLPNFERVEVTTFTPYDQKYVSKNGVKKDENGDDHRRFRRYVVIAIASVSVASVVILGTFCILLKRKKNSIGDESLLKKSELNSYAESTPRSEVPKLPQTHAPSRPIAFS